MKYILSVAGLLVSLGAFANDNKCITYERVCGVERDAGPGIPEFYRVVVQASTPDEPSSPFNRYWVGDYKIFADAVARMNQLRASGYCK